MPINLIACKANITSLLLITLCLILFRFVYLDAQSLYGDTFISAMYPLVCMYTRIIIMYLLMLYASYTFNANEGHIIFLETSTATSIRPNFVFMPTLHIQTHEIHYIMWKYYCNLQRQRLCTIFQRFSLNQLNGNIMVNNKVSA